MEKYTIFDFGLLHLEWSNALFVLVVFSICAFLMNRLLFQPVIQTLNNRKKWQGSGSDKLDELQKNIDNVVIEISNIKKNSLQKISKYREQQIKEIQQKSHEILQNTREALNAETQKFRHKLQLEITQLEDNSEKLSDKLVEQLRQKI